MKVCLLIITCLFIKISICAQNFAKIADDIEKKSIDGYKFAQKMNLKLKKNPSCEHCYYLANNENLAFSTKKNDDIYYNIENILIYYQNASNTLFLIDIKSENFISINYIREIINMDVFKKNDIFILRYKWKSDKPAPAVSFISFNRSLSKCNELTLFYKSSPWINEYKYYFEQHLSPQGDVIIKGEYLSLEGKNEKEKIYIPIKFDNQNVQYFDCTMIQENNFGYYLKHTE